MLKAQWEDVTKLGSMEEEKAMQYIATDTKRMDLGRRCYSKEELREKIQKDGADTIHITDIVTDDDVYIRIGDDKSGAIVRMLMKEDEASSDVPFEDKGWEEIIPFEEIQEVRLSYDKDVGEYVIKLILKE